MTDNFKTIYKNNVVVEIIMITPQEKPLVRKVRSLKADDTVSCNSCAGREGEGDGILRCLVSVGGKRQMEENTQLTNFIDKLPDLLDQSDAPSDWYSGGLRFNSWSGHISFIGIWS